jgi:hypothetical protein
VPGFDHPPNLALLIEVHEERDMHRILLMGRLLCLAGHTLPRHGLLQCTGVLLAAGRAGLFEVVALDNELRAAVLPDPLVRSAVAALLAGGRVLRLLCREPGVAGRLRAFDTYPAVALSRP